MKEEKWQPKRRIICGMSSTEECIWECCQVGDISDVAAEIADKLYDSFIS